MSGNFIVNNLTVEQCLQFHHIHPLHVQAEMTQKPITGHMNITAKTYIFIKLFPHRRGSFSAESITGHFKTMKTVHKGIVATDIILDLGIFFTQGW